jgi:hypothetical protein
MNAKSLFSIATVSAIFSLLSPGYSSDYNQYNDSGPKENSASHLVPKPELTHTEPIFMDPAMNSAPDKDDPGTQATTAQRHPFAQFLPMSRARYTEQIFRDSAPGEQPCARPHRPIGGGYVQNGNQNQGGEPGRGIALSIPAYAGELG